MPKKLSQEEVIKKFQAVHGDMYDYSKIKYVRMLDEVDIICPTHGKFRKTPAKHIGTPSQKPQGCPNCPGLNGMRGKKRTQEDIIRLFRDQHGYRYDYSKVIYIDDEKSVVIICKKHGPFEQLPLNHKKGSNCPSCNNENIAFTREKIIKLFNDIHKNKFDYSKVIYTGMHSHVVIICPKHGPWETSPSNHLHNASGCPKCSIESNAEELTSNLLGKKFWKLTAIIKQSKTFKKKVINGWIVQCDCGSKPFWIPTDELQRWKRKECSKCSLRNTGLKRQSNRDNICGRKSGRLTAIREWGTKLKKIGHRGFCVDPLVLCQCSCRERNQIVISRTSLMTKGTRSCGCLSDVVSSDSLNRFKNDAEWAGRDCVFYIAIYEYEHIFKIGISGNPEFRKYEARYKKYAFKSPILSRAESWTIEQCILKESIHAIPTSLPIELRHIGGRHEIRDSRIYPIKSAIKGYCEYLEQIQSLGWLEVFEKHVDKEISVSYETSET